jgi:hypothetical protein
MTIDKEPAISSAVTCSNICTADYEATPELVDKLKKGQMLQIQVGGLTSMIPSCCRSDKSSDTRMDTPAIGDIRSPNRGRTNDRDVPRT